MNLMLWCLTKSKTMTDEKEATNDERVGEVAKQTNEDARLLWIKSNPYYNLYHKE